MNIYDSLRDWEITDHEALISRYKDVLLQLGLSTVQADQDMAGFERELLVKCRADMLAHIAHNARSPWEKSQVKYCDYRIAELDDILAQ